MRFQKIPFYLRTSIDEIVDHAREHITIHYTREPNARGMGCKITDHNDYQDYFYEPNKYETLETRIILCNNQMSAHQNAVIALKKWEENVRDFLEKPKKKDTENEQKKSHTEVGDSEVHEAITQIETLLEVVASEQMNLHGETRETHASDHSHQGSGV